ncbi:MAG: hypothetical protein QXE05_09880 [Nitrososphaeria archaeon]
MKAPTFAELNSFTLKNYVNLIQYLSKTYKIVPLCEIPNKNVKYLILRHDIDWSLDAALAMAKIERDLRIKSTYFVLLSCNTYNIFEEKNKEILKEISNLGHEIGLHYYPPQYHTFRRSSKKILYEEVRSLEVLIGKKVYSIARHGPWDRDPFAAIKEYINANHPYYRGDVFVHDSCRAWAPIGDLFNLLALRPVKAQLLVHPENWQEDEIDRHVLLERLITCSAIKDYALIRKIREIWLTDPLVLKYNYLQNNEELMKQCCIQCAFTPKSKNNLEKKLKYYMTLIRWYLINSSIGWRCHLMLNSIRALNIKSRILKLNGEGFLNEDI